MDFSKVCLFRQTFNDLLSVIYHTIGLINNIYKFCEKVLFCCLQGILFEVFPFAL